ncbi:hypothetical protein PTKIN_Ptkin16aG0488900 [Pterospermum kingtungense]
MELQHFSHQHPLVFIEEWSNENEKFYCSGCGEMVSGPTFSCVACGFHLHKQCAEAPSEMNHPFHRNHNFNLLKLENANCFACWKPLLDAVHFSPDGGFYLHVKCADLSAEINHLLHPQHPLILQFNSQRLSCSICRKPQDRGLVYSCSSPCEFVLHIECSAIPTLQFVDEPLPCHLCQKTEDSETVHYLCSICKFVLHVGCASLPPTTIEDKPRHEHNFTLLRRELSLNCDACGTLGNFVPYICSTCNHIVHKKCISLPPIIKFSRHYHPILHTYFLEKRGFEKWECRVCHEEVNTEHGSYFCSECNYIVHVNCALEDPLRYYVVDSIETDEAVELSFKNVTATSIKHFSHDHNLTLSEDIVGDKQCDGCLLTTPAYCYYCSQCDFFLHKSCAELPMKKHIWYHHHQRLLRLTSGCIFQCEICSSETSGFAYTCDECEERHCLRCALVLDITKCEGHEHSLSFYRKYEGLCNACGGSTDFVYRCKSCNFNLDNICLILPLRARHKYDEHPYKLTYHDNNYSKSHYCDICEEKRNPNHWFYHCEICDNSAHPDCAFGKYSFIKPGSTCKLEDHPHPLTFVQQVHYYPECLICGNHCLDLALECTIGCSYIVHWECVKPRPFGYWTTIKLLPRDETSKQLIDGT